MTNDKDDMKYRKGVSKRIFDSSVVPDYDDFDDKDDDDEYTVERTEREIREDEEGGIRLFAILVYMILGSISTLIILGLIKLIF